MMCKKISFTISFIVLLFSFIGTTSYAMMDVGGKQANLSSYIGKGKWTIIEAWHSRCGVCMKTMPGLVEARGTFPNARLIGVSLDGNRQAALKILNRFNVNFPTLITNTREFDRFVRRIARRPLRGAPTYLIFSPSGKLKAMQAGNITPKSIRSYIAQQQRHK